MNENVKRKGMVILKKALESLGFIVMSIIIGIFISISIGVLIVGALTLLHFLWSIYNFIVVAIIIALAIYLKSQ